MKIIRNEEELHEWFLQLELEPTTRLDDSLSEVAFGSLRAAWEDKVRLLSDIQKTINDYEARMNKREVEITEMIRERDRYKTALNEIAKYTHSNCSGPECVMLCCVAREALKGSE